MADEANPTGGEGPSEEARFLREHWDPDFLGRYEGQWIAVLGREVIMAHTSIEALAAETIRRRPLYAFVTFADLQ